MGSPLLLALVVAALGALPLLRVPTFYMSDDTAAVFLPTWRAIGADLLSGTWPVLRPDFWLGGNFHAEAQFGLWSPLNLLLMMLVASLSNLALATAVVKVAFLEILALGAYFLGREYGARPALAAATAAALPFGGFTLYFDAAGWAAGLFAFALLPWFFLAARRSVRGTANPLWVFVAGYLLITNGSPYGALGAVVALAAVAVEALLTGNARAVPRLVVTGVAVGTTTLVAFLPLALTYPAGWRESAALVRPGELAPDLSMLLATSTPTNLPDILFWVSSGSTAPLTYTAWFLLPLLPWLRWEVLRERARELSALLVLGACYLVLALGPAELWLFRWPVRLVEYAALAALVVFGVLLSSGLADSARRARAVASAGFIGFGAWSALAARPDLVGRHVLGTALVLALTAAAVVLLRRDPRAGALALTAGTAVVLALQLHFTPIARDGHNWDLPPTVGELSAYAERYEPPVVQVADAFLVPSQDAVASRSELLFGNNPASIGVESTTSYSGIGLSAFTDPLCWRVGGGMCEQAFRVLWRPAGDAVALPTWLDGVKARTVVVQNLLVPDAAEFDPPAGWLRAAVTERVTVFERTGELPWPGTRLAGVAGALTVHEARSSETAENLVVSTGPEGGALAFARLAWPGYTATAGGRAVEVHRNAQGLVELELPGGLSEAPVELRFRVPGYRVAVPVLGLGVLLVLAQARVGRLRRRRGAVVGR